MTLQQEIDRLLGRGKPITDAHIRGLCIKYKKYKKATIEKMIQDSMKPYQATTPESFDGKRIDEPVMLLPDGVKPDTITIPLYPFIDKPGTLKPEDIFDEEYMKMHDKLAEDHIELQQSPMFAELMRKMDTEPEKKAFEYFEPVSPFTGTKPPTGPVTATMTLRNVVLTQRIKQLYQTKFPRVEFNLEALKSDAEANPEGSAELLGVQLTQMLIQL